MRIAFLCKRRYMGKDVILDRYARLYEIPAQLARNGHEVLGLCLDYRGTSEEGEWRELLGNGGLVWRSRRMSRWVVPTLWWYPRALLEELRAFKPDIVIGASDIPHVVWGRWLSRRLGVPYVADLYDNFEGFGQARIPGAVLALRLAVRSADLVLTTSEPLRALVQSGYRARGHVVAMPSTVDTAVFRPHDRAASRETLGLPSGVRLIGTAGGLSADKGIRTLYAAWRRIEQARDDVHLVLAGPYPSDCPPPQGPRVHYLGALAHDRIPLLFSALDVGLICILDTPFGRYCFPQKAYEMLACRIPVVAADVGAMSDLFSGLDDCLYAPGDAGMLAQRVLSQLQHPTPLMQPVEDWSQVIRRIEPMLFQLRDRPAAASVT